MSGQRQEFERELEAIEAKVIELFALLAEDLPKATQALLTGNNEVLQVLAERERSDGSTRRREPQPTRLSCAETCACSGCPTAAMS
jgi:hypothetical protein